MLLSHPRLPNSLLFLTHSAQQGLMSRFYHLARCS